MMDFEAHVAAIDRKLDGVMSAGPPAINQSSAAPFGHRQIEQSDDVDQDAQIPLPRLRRRVQPGMSTVVYVISRTNIWQDDSDSDNEFPSFPRPRRRVEPGMKYCGVGHRLC